MLLTYLGKKERKKERMKERKKERKEVRSLPATATATATVTATATATAAATTTTYNTQHRSLTHLCTYRIGLRSTRGVASQEWERLTIQARVSSSSGLVPAR